MASKSKMLYIFDIKNTQEDYAWCLMAINAIEETDVESKGASRFTVLKESADKISIAGKRLQFNGSKRYYEYPLRDSQGEKLIIDYKSGELRKLTSNLVNNRIWSSDFENVFHIRIHMQNDDGNMLPLYNLQYLALLMKSLSSLMKSKNVNSYRFSVFIVPESGNYYPFVNSEGIVDYATYDTVSQYLRLLAQNYCGSIFGVTSEQGQTVVEAIDYSVTKRVDYYFPLIPIDDFSYNILFGKNVSADILTKLTALKPKARFGDAASENPRAAMKDFLLETSWRHLEGELSSKTGATEKVKNILIEYGSKSLSVFEFSLFCFIYKLSQFEQSDDSIDRLIYNIRSLCLGLGQIAQNSIQHSASHEGVLTLSLNIDTDELADYQNALKIFLSDYNDFATFFDGFSNTLISEARNIAKTPDRDAYLNLANIKNEMMIAHFFGSKLDLNSIIARAWKNFRKADRSAHVGLLLFKSIVNLFDGSFEFISSTSGKVSERDYYSNIEMNHERVDMIIPGTQIALSLPIKEASVLRPTGLAQINMPNNAREDFECFARYINTREQEFGISGSNCLEYNSNAVKSSSNKLQAILQMQEIWVKALSDLKNGDTANHVFYLDMDNNSFKNNWSFDYFEIFWKGMLNAFFQTNLEVPLNIAIINAEEQMVDELRFLCISFAPKKFPANLQLYVCQKDIQNEILLLGDNFADAINFAYLYSIEHGTHSFSDDEVRYAYDITKDSLRGSAKIEKINVCPFDVILKYDRESGHSIFDRRIELLAEQPIDKYPSGYKFENTHMKLGNKIHIESFYEMSFLFYRTSISNRIAFEIVRDIISRASELTIDILKSPIIFYGYASYSKAILTALVEICKSYRQIMIGYLSENEFNIAIASYQYNLRSEQNNKDTQMYYDFANSIFEDNAEDRIARIIEQTNIIQIVPISSTLTTFVTMKNKLMNDLPPKDRNKISFKANYTVFLVSANDNSDESEWSKCYWKESKSSERTVSTCIKQIYYSNAINTNCSAEDCDDFGLSRVENTFDANVKFFMKVSTNWHNPTECKLCYPDNVLLEIPTVETDQTSTIPSQQIRSKTDRSSYDIEEILTNNERIKSLKGCVLYRHMRREKNHFRYYIDTQRLFNKVSSDVKLWLMSLSEKSSQGSRSPTMNIIFSPEHNTNVGFAQYVNNYYFSGGAEIVCLNEDKQYRSNFLCEHMALIHTINDILENCYDTKENGNINPPVRFFFVDDTIISGGTVHKANSFLISMISEKYRHFYANGIFSKCFVLVDRLSKESKASLISNPDDNFISYIHIDVSNERIQGDSCTGCKQEQLSIRLKKLSATRRMEEYWNNQANYYRPMRYDECINNADMRKDGYDRIVISHVLQNVLLKHVNLLKEGSIFDAFLSVIRYFLRKDADAENDPLLEPLDYLSDISQREKLALVFNVVSTPFFSYDFNLSVQIQTLIILIAESILNAATMQKVKVNSDEEERIAHQYKEFLFDKERLKNLSDIISLLKENVFHNEEKQILEFLEEVFMPCLASFHSTYLMRESTVINIFRYIFSSLDSKKIDRKFVDKFIINWIAQIQYIINVGSNETRAIRLERFLINRYSEHSFDEKFPDFIKKTFKVKPGNRKEYGKIFADFYDELFLQNTRIQYDHIEAIFTAAANSDSYNKNMSHSFEEEQIWMKFRNCDYISKNKENSIPVEELCLYKHLLERSKFFDSKAFYQGLLKRINNLSEKKYHFEKTYSVLITRSENSGPYFAQTLDIVCDTENGRDGSGYKKYRVKKHLESLLKDHENQCANLEETGYHFGKEEDEGKSYIYLYFDRPSSENDSNTQNKIVPVYLYFSCDTAPNGKLLMFIRDFLAYRNTFLDVLSIDFEGDTFAKYAHSAGERGILAHEKAASHNTTSDDRASLDALQNPQRYPYYSLDSSQEYKWLLLRNYTNGQIAKLFNRAYNGDSEEAKITRYGAQPLYLKEKNIDRKERPLNLFSDLRMTLDKRFIMLESVAKLNYQDLIGSRFISFNGSYYNAEFFRCLLIDVIFSALKFNSKEDTYLQRIDNYLKVEQALHHEFALDEDNKNDKLYEQCVITFNREKGDGAFDYLVIKNDVNAEKHSIKDIEHENNIIKARLEDSLDFIDGHMSLLTISRYIEGLDKSLSGKCVFNYVKEPDKKLEFVTKLPVLAIEGGNTNGRTDSNKH